MRSRLMVGSLAVLLLVGLAFAAWGVVRGGAGDAFDASPAWEEGEDVTVEGEVVENTADACREPVEPNQCIADLGNHLVLDVGGAHVTVEYSYGEWPPCDNVAAARAAHDLAVGEVVEVVARVERVDPVVLSTCPAPEYEIRLR